MWIWSVSSLSKGHISSFLPSGTRQSTAARQTFCPVPAKRRPPPGLPVFLLRSDAIPWDAALTSDSDNAWRTQEPAERPESLGGAAEDPPQVRHENQTNPTAGRLRMASLTWSFVYFRQEVRQLSNALDEEKKMRISLQVRLLILYVCCTQLWNWGNLKSQR